MPRGRQPEAPLRQFCTDVAGSNAHRCPARPLAPSAPDCTRGSGVSTQQGRPDTGAPARFGYPNRPRPLLNKRGLRGLEPATGKIHDFLFWVLRFVGICARAPVCLSAFISQTLVPSSRAAFKQARACDPWPVPPPLWGRWSGVCKPGARRRRRLRLYDAAHSLLTVALGTLNWLLLGYPTRPPPEARAGAPLSSEQSSIQDRPLCTSFAL